MNRPLEFHPYANLFPLIEGVEFGALVEDVRERGVLEDIWLLDGQILDGRNRYRASTVAGRALEKWQIKDFNPATMGEPLAWVLSKNLHRRHLNESQRAAVAAKLANLPAHRPATDKSANLQTSTGVSVAAAAGLMHVSERSVADAKKVMAKGSPELNKAVERGQIAVSAAAKAADLPPEQQAQVVQLAEDGKQNAVRTVVKKGARTAKEAALGVKQKALPKTRFGVIYADPEWRWDPRSRETGMDRAPDNHYPTSTTEEIMARDVPSIATADCVLFLWATAPMLPDALRVMEAWGFAYKSHFIWNKLRPGAGRGPGYWNTNEHELLLIGTRGTIPAPAPGTQHPSVISAPVGEHSEKPEVFALLIAEHYPSLPKIELNARRARPGWEVWGNEAPEAERPAPPPVQPQQLSKDEVRAVVTDRAPRWQSNLVTEPQSASSSVATNPPPRRVT